MLPVSPVIPGMEVAEIVYGKDQPEYIPIPVLKTTKGQILTRWKLSDLERAAIEEGADIYISVLTFNQPLQPIMISVAKPDKELTNTNLEIAKRFGIEI